MNKWEESTADGKASGYGSGASLFSGSKSEGVASSHAQLYTSEHFTHAFLDIESPNSLATRLKVAKQGELNGLHRSGLTRFGDLLRSEIDSMF